MSPGAEHEPSRPPSGPDATTGRLAGSDTGAQILYDHYKECLSALASQVRGRLRLLVLILAVLSALVVDTLTAEPLIELLTGIELPALKVKNLDIPPAVLISLLWFLLGSLVALMNQKSLFIEEQSAYARQLEARIDTLFGGGWIFKKRIPTRATYLNVANRVYFGSYVFLLFTSCVLVLYRELVRSLDELTTLPYFLFDLLVFLFFICGSLGLFIVDFRRLISGAPTGSDRQDLTRGQ